MSASNSLNNSWNSSPLVHISAEIGTSHGGSIDKARQLIDSAVSAGADSVKFQWVYAHEILHPNTGLVELPGGAIPLFQRFQQLEVPPTFFQAVRDYTKSKGCLFICSPFGLQSLEELVTLEPDAIKIASPELNHYPLLQKLAQIRKQQKEDGKNPVPVILSSGVSTLEDIERALTILTNPEKGASHLQGITLLHCVTAYPAPEEDYNLQVLQNLASIFGIEVGISDHSLHPYLVPSLATACGARFVEKHITLSKTTDGLDDPVALTPEEFGIMVQKIRQMEKPIYNYGCSCGSSIIIEELEEEFSKEKIQAVLGTGVKTLAPAEAANYGRTNRSIHVLHDMKAGDIITKDKIALLRTEKILNPGLNPRYWDTVMGTQLQKDIEAGQGLLWHHLLSMGS